MKMKKNPDGTDRILSYADILIMVLFATGSVAVGSLFVYVLTHETL